MGLVGKDVFWNCCLSWYCDMYKQHHYFHVGSTVLVFLSLPPE